MANKIKKEEEVKEKALSNESVIADLKKQLQHYEGMLLKTQGALEVLQQIEESKAKV